MIFHINRMAFKAGSTKEQRQAVLDAAPQAGEANPAGRWRVMGRELGAEFEYGAVYVVDNLDDYRAYLNHPARVQSELTGVELTERFVAFDVTDSDDPGIEEKIARLQARHLEESPELAALVAQATSFSVPGGAGSDAGGQK